MASINKLADLSAKWALIGGTGAVLSTLYMGHRYAQNEYSQHPWLLGYALPIIASPFTFFAGGIIVGGFRGYSPTEAVSFIASSPWLFSTYGTEYAEAGDSVGIRVIMAAMRPYFWAMRSLEQSGLIPTVETE